MIREFLRLFVWQVREGWPLIAVFTVTPWMAAALFALVETWSNRAR